VRAEQDDAERNERDGYDRDSDGPHDSTLDPDGQEYHWRVRPRVSLPNVVLSDSASDTRQVAPVALERFRTAYIRNNEALNRDGPELALARLPADFEWDVLADALPPQLRIETPPVLRGPEQIVSYFKQTRDEWDWQPHPEEFSDPGDGTIVVRVEGAITARATGLRGIIRFTQTWYFDEDGIPCKVRERLDDYFLERTRR
jgi:hypothetical protein